MWFGTLAKVEAKLERRDIVGLGHIKTMVKLRCLDPGVWCQLLKDTCHEDCGGGGEPAQSGVSESREQ